MGLKTAPNSFQLLMDKVLKGLTFKYLLCYMDDVIVSDSFERHLKDISEVMSRLESSGLKLNPKKCTFATNKAIFLDMKYLNMAFTLLQMELTVSKTFPFHQLQRSCVAPLECSTGLESIYRTTA